MRRLLLLALVPLLATTSAAAAPFRDCGQGFSCARVTVPVDYGAPDGPTTQIAVARRPATNPKRRIGTLWLNYGGPGAGAIGPTLSFGADLVGGLNRRFDIVAMDPRGTGHSRPALSCRADPERLGLYRRPFATPDTFDAMRAGAAAARYAGRCVARNPVLAAHLSTANVARDMDRVRRRLGERQISYLGFSYGTLLGATYAALFPQRVRAAVLDGPVDPGPYFGASPTVDADQAAAFERALRRYFGACTAHAEYCRWTGRRTPAAAYDRLVARLTARPLRGRIDGDAVNAAALEALYSKFSWPELTRALNGAVAGDGRGLARLVDDFYGRRRGSPFSPGTDRYFMITASEQTFPTDAAAYVAAGEQGFAATPHFFLNTGYGELPYRNYPERDADAFTGPFTLPPTAPRVLIVATTRDPATPYANAAGLAGALGRARVLTMVGDGHTATGGNSRCVDAAVSRYLLRVALPPKGLRCRQRVPFPLRPALAATAQIAAFVR